MNTDRSLSEKKDKLLELENRLQTFSSFAVAFSGGVDSTFLLAAVKKIKPKKCVAITVASEFVPEREIEFAKKMARSLKADHICLAADLLKNEAVAMNTRQRCYHCKKEVFSKIRDTATALGIRTLLHGVNQDDLKDFRPGLKAAEELGFLSPLAEAGLTKQEIRDLSQDFGLETWDRPSQSCLATRIPHDVRIDKEALVMVDRAEIFLQRLGFIQVRVRCFGKTARVEVAPALVKTLSKKDISARMSLALEDIGFEQVVIDREGYRTGKMNTDQDHPLSEQK